jgi:hypothetical protein
VVIALFPLLVGALALADRGPAMVLSMPWAVYGGRLSYSLYLVHIPMFEVFWLAQRRFTWLGPHTVFAHVAAVIVLGSTIVVAALLYRMIEEPAQRRLRAFRRPATATAVAPPAPRLAADALRTTADPVAAIQAARRALTSAVPGALPVLAPEPRHAASSGRRSTLSTVLVNAQRRRPLHRAELMADLERAEHVRSGYLHTSS